MVVALCVTVRERQHRYLQAAHRNVYQTFDEDILPFVDLTQHHEEQAAEPRASWTGTGVKEQEEKKEEEEEDEEEEDEEDEEEEDNDDDDDNPTDYANMSVESILNADNPIAELDHHTSEDVNENNN